MALVALGILLGSVLFLAYHRTFPSWLRNVRQLIAKSEGRGGGTSAKAVATHGGAKRPGQPAFGEGGKMVAVAAAAAPQQKKTSSPSLSTIPKGQASEKPIPVFTNTMISDESSDLPAQDEEQATPRASAQRAGNVGDIPTFSLGENDTTDKSTSSTSLETPSNTTSSSMKPSPKPTKLSPASAASLMPPPPIRPSALKPLPRASGLDGNLSTSSSPSSSFSSSLAPPPSSASSLRVPPGRLPAANSLAPSARGPAPSSPSSEASISTLPPSSRPSKKVTLKPGHSPLDWAALCRNPPTADFLRGAGLPVRLLRVSPAQLRQCNGRRGRDAWGTWQGKVYNLTPYRDFHPGGDRELYRGAGRAGETERLFREVHPWVNWDGMLGECLVGVLVSDGEGEGESGAGGQEQGQTDLDAVD